MDDAALFRAIQNGRIFHTFCEEEIAKTGRTQLDGRHLLFGESFYLQNLPRNKFGNEDGNLASMR